jgi:hypothetical protein
MNRSNTIYYKFKSEKKKYSINFDTTEISIGDIKKEIIKRRNMEKVPEKFELIFYDENNNEIRDENFKIEPLKLLIIRRIPWYKLTNTFMDKIRDPTEISSLRFSDFVITTRKSNITTINYIDPLDKVQRLSKDVIYDHFSCKLCKGIEDDPFIMMCCGNTTCEKCAEKTKKAEICEICKESYKGNMPNRKIKDLKDRVFGILNKPKEVPVVKPENIESIDYTSVNLQQNLLMNKIDNKLKLPQLTSLQQMPTQPHIQVHDISNPHSVFFENARFFIIKSSNKENVETSQKYSEWATTVTNQKKLNEAFLNNYVILIFSVNKSGNFQGYAVMSSFISDKVSSLWQNESSVKLGGSFAVQWLCICEMPFTKVKNMVNPINNNEYVIKSRDTQELPKDIGNSLCGYCYEQEKFENSYKATKTFFVDSDMVLRIQDEIKKNRESI